MKKLIEIRAYTLKQGTRPEFQRLFVEESLPLLKRWDHDVVAFGPSLHDDDSYYLIRAYDSLAQRQASQDAFYSSPEWQQGPREKTLVKIDHYTSIVIELESSVVNALRREEILPNPAMAESDPSHDFDFIFGRWRVHNRRLVKRLAGSNEWETFEALAQARPLPGGIGNCDDFTPLNWRPGFVGMSLRFFNPATKQWSIYWVDNQTGILQPPVVGGFANGVGTFEGPDEFQGQPIVVRFIWSNITSTGARWEQAFSTDDGHTWEVNWIMELNREES